VARGHHPPGDRTGPGTRARPGAGGARSLARVVRLRSVPVAPATATSPRRPCRAPPLRAAVGQPPAPNCVHLASPFIPGCRAGPGLPTIAVYTRRDMPGYARCLYGNGAGWVRPAAWGWLRRIHKCRRTPHPRPGPAGQQPAGQLPRRTGVERGLGCGGPRGGHLGLFDPGQGGAKRLRPANWLPVARCWPGTSGRLAPEEEGAWTCSGQVATAARGPAG